MWKTIVAIVAVSPFVALMLGTAILAARIGDTWSEATTASLVTGLVAVCGGGFVVIALILSLIVGIPMASRFFFEAGVARRSWDAAPPPRYIDAPRPWQEPRPPQLTDSQGGSWQSSGPAAYHLWEEDPVEVDRGKW